jgi:hypothetical protein
MWYFLSLIFGPGLDQKLAPLLVQRAVPRTKWRRAGIGVWILDWGCGECLEFLTIRNFSNLKVFLFATCSSLQLDFFSRDYQICLSWTMRTQINIWWFDCIYASRISYNIHQVYLYFYLFMCVVPWAFWIADYYHWLNNGYIWQAWRTD